MYIPNLCHPLHWSSDPTWEERPGLVTIDRSLGFHCFLWRIFQPAITLQKTVCGCNTGNSWLLQHDDIHSTFLAHKFVIINSQLCIQYSSQDVYKRGYVDVWSVCMQACKTRGIWGYAPPGNVRGSEIASEAIVGQKQYVLHPIWLSMYTFAC